LVSALVPGREGLRDGERERRASFSPVLNSAESHHIGCRTTTEARSLRPAAHLIAAAMSANILRGRESSLGVSRGLRQMASVLNGLNPLPPDVEAAFVLG